MSFDIHFTPETTPFRTSANILARFIEDGIAFARVIVTRNDPDENEFDWELQPKKWRSNKHKT